MEENAIRRLIFVCGRASKFPTVIVTAERIARDGTHRRAISVFGKATKNRRTSTAKPAALEAVDKNPEMGVGAPSYTSGAQKWNGTMDTLNPIPTRTSAKTPNATTGDKLPEANIPAS